MTKMIAALLVAFLAAGCSGGGAPSRTATPAPAVSRSEIGSNNAQPYASLVELRDAVIKAGYPCPHWRTNGKDDGPQHAKESGTCSDEDVFSTYADEAAVQQQVDKSVGVVILLVGPNWILNLPESHRAKVQAAIGGKIIDEGELTAENADPTTTFEPSRSDFEIKIQTLDKECFGSAGCLVKVRLEPEYVGNADLPETGTAEITYKIYGDEDGPPIGTISIEFPDGSYQPDERTIQTPSSSTKITAKVTNVAYSEGYR
jgi:hypothetical protein